MNKLAESYSKDKAVISEFLDSRHDLPSAVIDALLMRLVTLADFIKLLDDTREGITGKKQPDDGRPAPEGAA